HYLHYHISLPTPSPPRRSSDLAVGWIAGSTAIAQALRQKFARAHDLEPVAHLAPVPALLHEPHEMPALEPERLGVRELGAERVTGPGPPLAVRLGRLLRGLVVDRDLVVELHVVEDRHLVAPDHREAPH